MLMKTLFESISQRWMPEQVVKAILDEREDLLPQTRAFLARALPRHRYSSMANTFAKADDLRKQLATAERLFGVQAPPSADPSAVADYLLTLKSLLNVSGTDFKADRLCREDRRKDKVVPGGHRAYNKRFRLLHRMDEKYGRWLAVGNIRDLAQIAKSRLATRIEETAFCRDIETACFTAYMVARLNKRSIFTFDKQERPYDEIAEMLFQRLGDDADWFTVAHIHPVPEVLAHLTDEDRGRLLGIWYAIMVRAAQVLKEQEAAGGIDLVQLIVRAGNDSSTWNEAAGAFNKAREGWINLLHAMGGTALLDAFAPGKALRLMAADVAWGHRTFGKGLEPDTAVWGDLPKPWAVVIDGVACDRATIEETCKRHGIEGKGWIAPREKSIAVFKPTPELVHGVVISCPALAGVLKHLGYFGGPSKAPAQGSVPISREFDGKNTRVDFAK